jgi:Neuraminidase (sialidase)
MVTYEEKGDRFRRLASQRTNNVLKAVQVLGNCSNKSTYSYTPEEINKIFAEIERKLKETKTLFRTGNIQGKEFRL